MAIKGIFFDNQTFNAKDFGAFASVLGDCFVGKHQCSIANGTLTIPSGYIVVGGRLIQFDGNQQIALVPTVTNGYGRIVLTIDLTKASTQTTFSQVSLSQEYASTLEGFNDLTQTDINLSGSIYQRDIIHIWVNNGVCYINDSTKARGIPFLANITEATHSFDNLTKGTLVLNPNNYGSTLPSSGVEGQIFFKI